MPRLRRAKGKGTMKAGKDDEKGQGKSKESGDVLKAEDNNAEHDAGDNSCRRITTPLAEARCDRCFDVGHVAELCPGIAVADAMVELILEADMRPDLRGMASENRPIAGTLDKLALDLSNCRINVGMENKIDVQNSSTKESNTKESNTKESNTDESNIK